VVGYIWWVETILTGGVHMVGRDHIYYQYIWWVETVFAGRVYTVGRDHIHWWGIYSG